MGKWVFSSLGAFTFGHFYAGFGFTLSSEHCWLPPYVHVIPMMSALQRMGCRIRHSCTMQYYISVAIFQISTEAGKCMEAQEQEEKQMHTKDSSTCSAKQPDHWKASLKTRKENKSQGTAQPPLRSGVKVLFTPKNCPG